MPPGRALDGDDVLLLIYWKQRPPRISTVVTPPLAGEELCHSDLPRSIIRGVPHRSGFASGVTSTLAHTRYQSVQCGIATGLGITGLGNSATLNDKLVFAREDHLDLPIDFSLAEGVSPLSDLLMVSKEEFVVNSCGLISMITPRNNF